MSQNVAMALGTVLIVGGGNMGQAICSGLLRIEGMDPKRITVANPGEQKRKAIEAQYGVRTVADAAAGLPAQTIIIAVKPNCVPQVARTIAAALDGASLVISIAAGISTDFLAEILGNKLPIVRVMPNTPLMCGYGMSAVSGGAHATSEDCKLVCEVFSAMGDAVIVDEDKQDIVTALSGSGPAYFELMLETMAREGEKLGLDYKTSLELSLKTMHGTAAMLDQTHQDLNEAIDAVSSPGGTTVAALDAMRKAGMVDAVESGVAAAAKRSKELGC